MPASVAATVPFQDPSEGSRDVKKTKVAILVIVLAAACETSSSGCDFLMQPEVQDGPNQEQVTTPAGHLAGSQHQTSREVVAGGFTGLGDPGPSGRRGTRRWWGFSLPGPGFSGVARIACWVFAALAGIWVVACGDSGGTDTPVDPGTPNRAPEAVGSIPTRMLTEGDTVAFDVSSHFRDPDGNALTYAAASSDAGVASASVSGATVSIAALVAGTATVTITAVIRADSAPRRR